ncbi:MAG: Hpt domain-containing protein [Paracoccaceae bacterium]|nr:Hpt domain-containing protein [Paracoccaceae bacterium]
MIDWDRVTQLRDEVGPDGFAEVVELFLEEVEEVTGRLASANGAKALEEDLHFLKGSALNLGFERLGVMCQEAERLAARGEVEAVSIEPILACYETSRQSFLETLAVRRVA